MNRIFYALLLIVFISISGYSWVDTTGSTWATTSTDYDERTISNLTFDEPISSVKVTITSGTIVDDRYSGAVSTGTSGFINASGNISISNYNVDNYSFLARGGNINITSTFMDGIIYALEDIPIDVYLSVPTNSPTFQCTLPSGASLYYIITGVKK